MKPRERLKSPIRAWDSLLATLSLALLSYPTTTNLVYQQQCSLELLCQDAG
jgi:hypothetical protein